MFAPKPLFSPAHLGERIHNETDALEQQAKRLRDSAQVHSQRMQKAQEAFVQLLQRQGAAIAEGMQQLVAQGRLADAARAYWIDAMQRAVLTLDTLRERGNNDLAHEAAGAPPVLIYDHELVLDGRQLPRPVNYQLLHILPPKGVSVHNWKRPYMIIDPRAGHGAGIGGFKQDSQVGVALRAGHPVYFVVFRQRPEYGQTLADVMRAEAAFVREIARRHPDSPAPIIVGNCQGGWATMLLAAANPDITGPLVINGAPMAYWSGHLGDSTMRYNGGLLGGAMPALLLSDLGHGQFDGAHLVSNFELLNPGRNFFGKYYDLFAHVDHAREAFLEFEKWWGGFHFTNEAEIRWIVEQLFVGNKLTRGEAALEHGRPLDLKAIRSPIIVFASKGDNITPPQQALNWIADTYADEREIVIRGNRIIYMVHERVGHLGIFVSSSVARKEHAEVTSTLKTIESLAPGLYEMVIEDIHENDGQEHFVVSFQSRTMADLQAHISPDRCEERDFAAVARLSELGVHVYEIWLRPLVQSLVTPQLAKAIEETHPSRVSRRAFAEAYNPAMPLVAFAAEQARAERAPVGEDNPFLQAERLAAASVAHGLDLLRDVRDAAYELTFFSLYGTPFMQWVGTTHAYSRTRKDPSELRYLPEVQAMLMAIGQGGLMEAVIRMLILLADSRGAVRRDRLERSSKVLTEEAPFASLSDAERGALIRQQSIIVEFEREKAIRALPRLLPTRELRERALETVRYVLGPQEEMAPETLALLQRFEALLHAEPEVLPPRCAPAFTPASIPTAASDAAVAARPRPARAPAARGASARSKTRSAAAPVGGPASATAPAAADAAAQATAQPPQPAPEAAASDPNAGGAAAAAPAPAEAAAPGPVGTAAKPVAAQGNQDSAADDAATAAGRPAKARVPRRSSRRA